MNILAQNKRPASFLAILLAFILCPIPCTQYPAFAAFEDMGLGARAAGMGDAFTAVADDINAIYYNPAGLADIGRPKAMASHSILYSGLSDGSSLGLSNAAFAMPLDNGRLGGLGFLWNQFSLSGIYAEKAMQLSYGYRFPKGTSLEKFSVGTSLKYLTHSFSRLDEAYNAVNSVDGISATNASDPVLVGANSKSALGADLGILYRLDKHYTLGLAVLDANQPDVGFSQKDPVPMKTRLGASYKALWLLLTSEIKMQKGPGGTQDKQFIFGAEKTFPSLDKGDISARMSLGIGDREFRQITAGLSYKISKIQFDYGFSIPLGTVQNTIGSHKLAMVYHFGSPTADEQAATEFLEQYKKIREAADYKSGRDTASLDDPRLAQINAEVEKENYQAASKLLVDKAGELLPDTSVINLTRRLAAVAAFYPAMPPKEGRDKATQLLSSGIRDFLRGKDINAMHELSYAQSLNQQDSTLSNFVDKAEEVSRIKADRVPVTFNRGWPQYKIEESDLFYAQKKYEDALERLDAAMEFEKDNPIALKKSGSCHYLLGNYIQADKDWERALKLETDPTEKEKLVKAIAEAKSQQGPNWQTPATAGTTAATATGPGAAAAKETPKPSGKDPREIEKLYQQGADFYTKSDYGKAADIFRRILTLDPGNTQAKKALERIIRLSR
ncbi:MAG: hypothetical protein NTX59_06825 [Elusimicrobia bacterium]|nr:hypothetical protein [Elusimicrobiota bacterium]